MLGCSKIFFPPKVLLLFQTDNGEALVKEPVLFSTLFFFNKIFVILDEWLYKCVRGV